MAVCVSGSTEEQTGGGPGAEAEGLQAAAPPGASGCMAQSVTRHIEITELKEWKRLAVGIDGLDVSACVTWRDEYEALMEDLETGKLRAQSRNESVLWRETRWGPALVWPSGKRGYRYHVQLRELHLFLSVAQTATRTPNVYASMNSEALWRDGKTDLVAMLLSVLTDLGGLVEQVKPSRCDLCADFLIPGGMSLEFLRSLGVPENICATAYMRGRELETYYIGSPKAAIRARIYDKSKEIEVSHKAWFWPVWGIEPTPDVWRIELQLRRPVLHAFRINSIDELSESLGGMWRNLLLTWFSLRLRDDSNTTRRTIHPWWQAVLECADEFGPATDCKRNLGNSNKAKAEYYISRGAGCLLGYAATMGMAQADKAVIPFGAAMRRYWRNREDKSWDEAITVKLVEQAGPLPRDKRGGDKGSEVGIEGGTDEVPI